TRRAPSSLDVEFALEALRVVVVRLVARGAQVAVVPGGQAPREVRDLAGGDGVDATDEGAGRGARRLTGGDGPAEGDARVRDRLAALELHELEAVGILARVRHLQRDALGSVARGRGDRGVAERQVDHAVGRRLVRRLRALHVERRDHAVGDVRRTV